VVCTGTNLPVSSPFVYKMFIRVVQLSCYRSKSAPDRNQVLNFEPYLTGEKKSVSYNAYLANGRSGKLSLFIRRDVPVRCTNSTAHYIVSKTARRRSRMDASCTDTHPSPITTNSD
jgi:hypothetical protein